RAEIALMSGYAFAVTHHAFSSGAGRISDGNESHASTLKSPSYTKSVSWQHYPYDDAVGVTSSMLKISCPKEVAGVKLSLITNDKITGNDKAIASSNDTVGYYLYLGDNSDVLDVSAPFNIESYKTAEGQYAIPFKAKYLKLTDNSVQSGDVLSSLVMRVAQD
ncbi:hypothetical protein ACTMLE_21860, partial [Escherichia coli]